MRKRKTYSVIQFNWWKLLLSLLVFVPIAAPKKLIPLLQVTSSSFFCSVSKVNFFVVLVFWTLLPIDLASLSDLLGSNLLIFEY